MRFCTDHWTRLREAVDAEGIGGLVAQDGKRAAEMFAASVTGGETLASFDPLMWCHWSIVGRIAEHQPAVIFIDGCPLCWVADVHEEHCHDPACTVTRQTFEDWIPVVASAAAKRARELREAESKASA